MASWLAAESPLPDKGGKLNGGTFTGFLASRMQQSFESLSLFLKAIAKVSAKIAFHAKPIYAT